MDLSCFNVIFPDIHIGTHKMMVSYRSIKSANRLRSRAESWIVQAQLSGRGKDRPALDPQEIV